MSTNGAVAATRATVYAGGCRIETEKSVGLSSVPLTVPTGQGVTAIAIPAGTKTTGYFGPTEVRIEGDGTGATAHCLFDRAAGTIGPIVVTSPGCDYTRATAKIYSSDRRTAIACPVTLGTCPSGGLVKTGPGTLALKAENTYTGETVISNGTIKLVAEKALPAGNAVRLAGGALDLNGGARTLATLAGCGAVKNGTLTLTDAVRLTAAEAQDPTAFLDVQGTLVWTQNGLTVVDPENLDDAQQHSSTLVRFATLQTACPHVAVPEPWRVYLTDVGTALKLAYPRGTLCIFR